MALQSLLFCSDDKIVRVLRRVLSDLDINVEHCTDVNGALHRITRQRFEAVVVDCAEEAAAAKLLGSARSAPCNKHAVAVAVIDGQKAVRSAFTLGAHFVLYKPLSTERARTSFRAARALMKCERRRNARVPVEIPVALMLGTKPIHAKTFDLGEGGMAIKCVVPPLRTEPLRVKFTLPGSSSELECAVQIAWENPKAQTGVRFVDMSPAMHDELKAWLTRQSPDLEPDDPPAQCKLTDLSLGGCYLELPAPFPVRTRVILSMGVSNMKVRAQGIVRVTHAEKGMGLEFTRATTEQRQQVETFIQTLVSSKLTPDIAVEPEGLEDADAVDPIPVATGEDPLLDLFRNKGTLPTETFLIELQKQRHTPASAVASAQ